MRRGPGAGRHCERGGDRESSRPVEANYRRAKTIACFWRVLGGYEGRDTHSSTRIRRQSGDWRSRAKAGRFASWPYPSMPHRGPSCGGQVLRMNRPVGRFTNSKEAELRAQQEIPGLSGGGGGIRTHETLSSLTVFKTAGVNRFPTPPN